MKLSAASTLSLLEAATIEGLPICEDGEGPRWKFNYANWHNDPKPDILLLGAYQHPNTGNNLVGGINLNYLNRRQRDDIARVLPQIMQAGNLYSRYHTGKRLLPNIFDNFYRTYNAAHIRGVETDVLYPKYGFMKSAKNFVKKAIGGLFKSREQRAQDAQPKYPSDLEGMTDMLDNVVLRLGKQPPPPPQQPDTPEMQAARAAMQKYKMDRAQSMMNIDQQEADPFIQANQEFQQQQLQQRAARPQAVTPDVQQQAMAEPPAVVQPQQPTEPSPQDLGQMIQRDRAKNQQELSDPANDINLDVQEAIRYYSPVTKCFIMESIGPNHKQDQLYQKLNILRPQLVAAAQTIYDEWDELEEGGGICDSISQALGDVLVTNGIDSTEGGHDGDDHSYLIAFDEGTSFIVDIDPYTYESGGGYSWTKLPGVVFSPSDIIIAPVERPDWIDDEADRFG